MKNNKTTILAISPGTRYIGIAVLAGSDLTDWGVKVLAGRWSNEKLTKVSAQIIETIEWHRPDCIALKQPHPSRTSPQLNDLCRTISETAGKHGLTVYRLSLQQIKDHYLQGGNASRADMAEIITLKYPCLTRFLNREKQACNPYYMRMFEAVALGNAIYSSLSNKNRV